MTSALIICGPIMSESAPSKGRLLWEKILVTLGDFRYEVIGLVLILVASILPRLTFVNAFPSRPLSDFDNILNLALSFEQDWLAKDNLYWQYFSAGLPLILSVLFRLVSFPPEVIARWATAIITGLPAIVPHIIWKDVFSLRVRLTAGLLLALWPGQILFSSVLAQDNWIILPTVVLAALAVRTMAGKNGNHPILGAVSYVVAGAIRQEMFIALLPMAIPAMLGSQKERFIRNFLAGSLVIGALCSALVVQRGLATGRYALSTQHFGVSTLGAYVPGAGMGWTSPIPYLEVAHPEILERNQLEKEAFRLVWEEFLRRPKFQIIRMAGSPLYNLFEADKGVLWWSLTAEGVLPHKYRKSAAALFSDLTPLLEFYPRLILALFLSSVFFAFRHRELIKWISPILIAIILKVGIHALIVSQPRYFLVVTALEVMTIAIVSDSILRLSNWRPALLSLAFGVLGVCLLSALTEKAKAYVEINDEVSRPGYQSTLSEGQASIIMSHVLRLPSSSARPLIYPGRNPSENDERTALLVRSSFSESLLHPSAFLCCVSFVFPLSLPWPMTKF